jgi:hypothetical protein
MLEGWEWIIIIGGISFSMFAALINSSFALFRKAENKYTPKLLTATSVTIQPFGQ